MRCWPAGAGSTVACSRTQVSLWKRKTAWSPAARAGLMSLLGLLPIIQAGVGRELVAGDDFAVGGRVFFGDDFDGGEVRGEAGAGELVGLLGVVALGHEDEAVAGGERRRGFRRRRGGARSPARRWSGRSCGCGRVFRR